MSPLYDFECAHGHVFEKQLPMAQSSAEIPCEGTVNQLLTDQELEAPPADVQHVELAPGSEDKVAVRPVPCILKAKRIITHSSPAAILDHGLARNRDNAREGKYDPLRPATNIMSKGRSWRK